MTTSLSIPAVKLKFDPSIAFFKIPKQLSNQIWMSERFHYCIISGALYSRIACLIWYPQLDTELVQTVEHLSPFQLEQWFFLRVLARLVRFLIHGRWGDSIAAAITAIWFNQNFLSFLACQLLSSFRKPEQSFYCVVRLNSVIKILNFEKKNYPPV